MMVILIKVNLRFLGEYLNGKKEGFGVYVWGDGRRYEGFWKEGKQHGDGIFHLDKESIKGRWENGGFKEAYNNNSFLSEIEKLILF